MDKFQKSQIKTKIAKKQRQINYLDHMKIKPEIEKALRSKLKQKKKVLNRRMNKRKTSRKDVQSENQYEVPNFSIFKF